uniref:DUF58 domain-containing protein n=1 Tax=Rhodococcus rhodochrous TaxID=1829 RepID=UPI003FD01F35
VTVPAFTRSAERMRRERRHLGVRTVFLLLLSLAVGAEPLVAQQTATPQGSPLRVALPATRGDLQGLVESLRRPQRRRGLAVVVSDFLGPLDWERSLRALSGRHELLAVEIIDRRDLELPDLGDVVLHDPETGRTREFTTTPELRADYAQAAAEHRAAVHQALRSSGAPVLTLRTDRDWIGDVVRFVAARRHSFGAPARQGGR